MGCRLADSTPVGWLSDTFVPETSDWFGRPVHYCSALYNATRWTIHRGLSSSQERRSEPQGRHRCVEGNLAEPRTKWRSSARLLHALEDPLDRLEAPIEGLPFRAPLADRTEPSGGADGALYAWAPESPLRSGLDTPMARPACEFCTLFSTIARRVLRQMKVLIRCLRSHVTGGPVCPTCVALGGLGGLRRRGRSSACRVEQFDTASESSVRTVRTSYSSRR